MNKNSKLGFTLVELLVSLCIFSVLSGAMFFALGSQLRNWKRVAAFCESAQINNFALSGITTDIRAAAEIIPTSGQDMLILKIGADVIEYSLSDKKIKRRKNNYSAYLTDVNEVKQLTFDYPEAKLVRVSTEAFTAQAAIRN
ncbi:hypothetical protein A2291_04490 [candidate division WOR-1 bacterium RIFOXYB2_FULL_42_35]|uniref:Prepilin-type N-terminal cleavage/methylation domain-containing protein n=1 Tax=candidate division WOR-1 bacterium RIFOXYC2_FULL_41_25 TaxID=1802586 RepID=A0A1F4TR96_UNCSA|nr:MAG: hypothetical protein A2247_07605 [candidate division WOR-1 bacterium RIFOXYA2_FULL_41_14]OGC25822.1 MAG: hypothetical protein A2291_04490 [candidate division WOR-1 bacterium RIFOXYB2_FULL_42_35]OGC35262.1 MAG: hypothetical protein A2462_08480 [candidate division WOR-1 bacterium RIFOXYC2_FULL_41_25]OGC43445.1 MAG: hypothetical protein A2548_00535 [candidate division WOR-1 bacterium RIFOXYD2_FULL_41_8]